MVFINLCITLYHHIQWNDMEDVKCLNNLNIRRFNGRCFLSFLCFVWYCSRRRLIPLTAMVRTCPTDSPYKTSSVPNEVPKPKPKRRAKASPRRKRPTQPPAPRMVPSPSVGKINLWPLRLVHVESCCSSRSDRQKVKTFQLLLIKKKRMIHFLIGLLWCGWIYRSFVRFYIFADYLIFVVPFGTIGKNVDELLWFSRYSWPNDQRRGSMFHHTICFIFL